MLYSTTSDFFANFSSLNTRDERKFIRRGGLCREYITLNHHLYG